METISLLGIIVAIAAMVMFVAYLWLMAKLHGIQPSISDNYYVSRHRWTFVMVMWWIGFGMLPAMLEVTPEIWQFSAFFCCCGVIFVGAAAAFREEVTRQVHFAGAITSAAGAFIWTACVLPPMAGVGFLTCCGLLLWLSRHVVYWLEVTCFAMVFVTYIRRILML